MSAHPFPESLRIWSRAERDAALGSGKKLKSHCQLGVELGHKCKMLAVTFTFQSAAKRTVLLEGNSPFSESHPVVFRLSTAAGGPGCGFVCLFCSGSCLPKSPSLSGQLSLNVSGLSVQVSQGLID